jgi:hypothetical protein
MTLESDRPERGSDDRHNAPASGASGALPPSLENVLPGKTLNQKTSVYEESFDFLIFFLKITKLRDDSHTQKFERDLLPVRTHNRIRSPR